MAASHGSDNLVFAGNRPPARALGVGCGRFNLVELVVVLTTLVCLVSLVVPVFFRTSLVAKTNGCSNNLRQIGTAIKMYSEDNESLLPTYEMGWVAPAAKYLGLTLDQAAPPEDVFACPSQSTKSLDADLSDGAYWRGTHYGINQHIASNLTDASGERYPEWAQADMRRIKAAAFKLLVADSMGGNFFRIAEYDPTVAGLSNEGLTYADSLPPNAVRPFPYLRHNDGSGNFLFLDGHVETRQSWPEFMLGAGTAGYEFWHAEHWYPGCGRERPPEVKKDRNVR